jgi:hypothetical protein
MHMAGGMHRGGMHVHPVHPPLGTVKRGNIEQVINFKVKLKILRDVL